VTDQSPRTISVNNST